MIDDIPVTLNALARHQAITHLLTGLFWPAGMGNAYGSC